MAARPDPFPDAATLDALLAEFPRRRLAVAGDFFLDKYWTIDPALDEPSLETGLPARQVVAVRQSPGAAGTVANNLTALGCGQLRAIGVVGDDGHGWELRRELERRGVDASGLVTTPGRATPTYGKPVELAGGGARELPRLDIVPRTPLPAAAEDDLLRHLHAAFAQCDGVAIVDQTCVDGAGVWTPRLRAELPGLAARRPQVATLADSRRRFADFRGVALKPNRGELAALCGAQGAFNVPEAAARAASARGQTLFATDGANGLYAAAPGQPPFHAPALPWDGPVDPTGAGDSAAAAILLALAAGGTLAQAATLGAWVSALTVRQLRTTGVATPAMLRALFPD